MSSDSKMMRILLTIAVVFCIVYFYTPIGNILVSSTEASETALEGTKNETENANLPSSPIPEEPLPFSERVMKNLKNNPKILALIVLLFLGFVAVMFIVMWNNFKENVSEEREKVKAFYDEDLDGEIANRMHPSVQRVSLERYELQKKFYTEKMVRELQMSPGYTKMMKEKGTEEKEHNWQLRERLDSAENSPSNANDLDREEEEVDDNMYTYNGMALNRSPSPKRKTDHIKKRIDFFEHQNQYESEMQNQSPRHSLPDKRFHLYN